MSQITVSMTNFQKFTVTALVKDANGNNVALNGLPDIVVNTPSLISVANVQADSASNPKQITFDVLGVKTATTGGTANISLACDPGNGLAKFTVDAVTVNVSIDPREAGPATTLSVSATTPVDQ